MKRLLGLVVGVLAVLLLLPAQAGASALTDCLGQQAVCVAGDGRSLISQGQQDKLERQIGGDHQRAKRARAVHRRLPGHPAAAFRRP
jgi:hypothetical protein